MVGVGGGKIDSAKCKSYVYMTEDHSDFSGGGRNLVALTPADFCCLSTLWLASILEVLPPLFDYVWRISAIKGRCLQTIAYSFILLSSVVQNALNPNSNHGHEDQENPNYLQWSGHFIEEQYLEELQSFVKLRHY